MNTIIAIWNSGGKGKSSTILNLANLLMSSFIHKVIYCDKKPSTLTIDFTLILEINGKIIALESKGDPKTDLEKRLNNIAVKYHPNLIICSTRTRGETVHAVHNTANKYGFDTIWTSTYQIMHSHSVVNNLKSDHLLDLIVKLGLI
jgi:cellulose biosynthesis protein BcsQ